jgi:ornithine cyclodeaminase/alanine dehydrogenase-like protein (mu-crystallin family)
LLYLTETDVRRLLPMAAAIELMRSAFARLAAGEALNQPRRRLILPTGSVLHYMAGSDGKYFGSKIYSTHARHGAHFFFLLFRGQDGQPLALLEANWLGQIRTGAVSGLATQQMARPDAESVGLIGSGFQARSQLDATRAVRPIRTVRVWSPTREKREAFAAECRAEAAPGPEQAVRGADIVITATNAKEPVLDSSWIAPGTHVNAMGSNQARRRELPAELIRRADRIVVDSLEQARMESGDLLLAWGEKEWDHAGLAELKDVVAGQVPGRRTSAEVTVFKSNGLAVEDVISAGFVYEKALETGSGRPMATLYS